MVEHKHENPTLCYEDNRGKVVKIKFKNNSASFHYDDRYMFDIPKEVVTEMSDAWGLGFPQCPDCERSTQSE